MQSHFAIVPQTLCLDSDNKDGLHFLRLPHPRTGLPSLFLPSHDSSSPVILEVQAIAPTNPRSWFLNEEITADGKLLVLTPIDPAFLLAPMLRLCQPQDSPGNFRPPEDIFEDVIPRVVASSSQGTPLDESATITAQDISKFLELPCILPTMRLICESKEITPEITVYRSSTAQFVSYLKRKADRLVENRVLEKSKTVIRGLAKDGLMDDGKEQLLSDGWKKAACDLVGQYVSTDVLAQLTALFDFTSLDAHLKAISEEALASAVAPAPEKDKSKSKKDASKEKATTTKRKSTNSHGVEQLKKANTSGMKKLSSFFTPKTAS